MLSDVTFLAGTFFDNMDFLVSNILLPLGALLFSLFTGYVLDQRMSHSELVTQSYQEPLFKLWIFLLKFVIPLVIIGVFLSLIMK